MISQCCCRVDCDTAVLLSSRVLRILIHRISAWLPYIGEGSHQEVSLYMTVDDEGIAEVSELRVGGCKAQRE